MSVAPILFVSGRLRSTVPAGIQGMVLVPCLTLCAAFSVRPWSLPSGNPWSDGSSRYWPCQSEKSGKQLPTSPRSEMRGRSRKQRFGPGLPIGESARRRPALEASAPVGEVGRRSCRAGVCSFGRPSGRRPVCPSGPFFSDVRLFSWAEPGRRSRSPRDPGFMNLTSALTGRTLPASGHI